MTPPMTRPLAGVMSVVAFFVLITVAVAMPLARRNDGIGWAAFLAISAVAISLWVLLIWGLVRRFLQWRRGG